MNQKNARERRPPRDWTGEYEVSQELAAELIAAQFPQLAPVRCQPLGTGWDNVALRVNGRFVFRFPRRTLGATLLEAELRVMPAIAPRLPLTVSCPIYKGTPSERFAWPFAGYEFIPGRTACSARLTSQQRRELAVPLSRFLRALHSVPFDFARAHGAVPDPLGRFDMSFRVGQARQRLGYIADHNLFNRVPALLAVIDSAPPDYVTRFDVLVHGDLYSRHLIIDDDGRAAGIIDWGDVHLGNPAADLMVAWTLLAPDARQVFLSQYGGVDELTWRMSRFRAVNHAACVVHYAHRTNAADLLHEGLLALEHLMHV
jgi:aminoglycoside phosphotransferase (APT) family kinase protein